MPILRRLCLALSLVLPMAATAQTEAADDAATPAQASPVTNGQSFGAWTVACVAVAVGETDCTLNQRVLRASDTAFVADLIATRDDEGKTYLVARVPVGVFLPNGFAMREAENEDVEDAMEFTWQTCNREVCEALLEVDAEMVTTLSAQDNAMIAGFRPNSQMEPFVFQLSLNGLGPGLDAIRP